VGDFPRAFLSVGSCYRFLEIYNKVLSAIDRKPCINRKKNIMRGFTLLFNFKAQAPECVLVCKVLPDLTDKLLSRRQSVSYIKSGVNEPWSFIVKEQHGI
jgi:hypothetical protein